MDRKKEIDAPEPDRSSDNPSDFVEMFCGSNLNYAWHAEISRDPGAQGLDGGRVKYVSVSKWNEAVDAYGEAPNLEDEQAYEQWVTAHPPRWLQVACYRDGVLTCEASDPHAAAIVDDVKRTAATYVMRDTKQAHDEIEECFFSAFITLEEVCGTDISSEAARARELLRSALLKADNREGLWEPDSLPLVREAHLALESCGDALERKAGQDCAKGIRFLDQQLSMQVTEKANFWLDGPDPSSGSCRHGWNDAVSRLTDRAPKRELSHNPEHDRDR